MGKPLGKSPLAVHTIVYTSSLVCTDLNNCQLFRTGLNVACIVILLSWLSGSSAQANFQLSIAAFGNVNLRVTSILLLKLTVKFIVTLGEPSFWKVTSVVMGELNAPGTIQRYQY